jgi:hypothetical protein
MQINLTERNEAHIMILKNFVSFPVSQFEQRAIRLIPSFQLEHVRVTTVWNGEFVLIKNLY